MQLNQICILVLWVHQVVGDPSCQSMEQFPSTNFEYDHSAYSQNGVGFDFRDPAVQYSYSCVQTWSYGEMNEDPFTGSNSPDWFYFEAAASGSINLRMTATNDYDFLVWGPFDDASDAISSCDSLPVSAVVACAFNWSGDNADYHESEVIFEANIGDIYIVMVFEFIFQSNDAVALSLEYEEACSSFGLTLSPQHACECSSSSCDASDSYCNSMSFVLSKLEVTNDNVASLCPHSNAAHCCCSCQNCDNYIPPVLTPPPQ